MGIIVGIDLGTTNSLIAILGEDAPQIIRSSVGELYTPSAVAINDDGELVVGRLALELIAQNPECGTTLFKRNMGTQLTQKIRGKEYGPAELSARVLKALKHDAQAETLEEVTDAVITVPAYFNDAQRQATKDAGELAGLNVRRILNEPTAAAMAYSLHLDPTERKVLIFDLGGGTFDISILDCADGVLQVMASAGEGHLGGEDFTRCLMEIVLQPIGVTLPQLEMRSPLLFAKLRRRVENAKCQLSEPGSTEVSITLPDPKSPKQWRELKRIKVTKDEFVRATRGLVDRFAIPTWRALRDAGLRPGDIDEVLLVGGATRMPVVTEWLSDFFGKSAHCKRDPDLVVAEGAAIQAGLVGDHAAVADIIVTDVMPHTLGVAVVKEFGGQYRDGYFLPIIERNTTIPVSRTDVLWTVSHNQATILCRIFQGEFPRAEQNLLLGTLEVAGIPRGPKGREGVELRFTYDLNGLLEVEATILSTQKKQSMVIEHRPGRLSESERRKALKAMMAIKLHPRDRAENRLVLEQAMRAFSEHTGPIRGQLSELTDAFEECLQGGILEDIERARDELSIFLSYIAGMESGEADAE